MGRAWKGGEPASQAPARLGSRSGGCDGTGVGEAYADADSYLWSVSFYIFTMFYERYADDCRLDDIESTDVRVLL